MKKRILLVLLTLVLTVALIIPMAVPVAASGVTTLNLNVQGYEIFAGIVSGGNRYGATFIAQVAGGDTNGNTYCGALTVSTNYKGASPTPGETNLLIGGSWTLTLTQNGKTVGTIVGKISGGTVDWYPKIPSGTDYGVVTAPITFMGISKTFAGKSGGGTFTGKDIHASNVYLFGIEVPVVTGVLTLNF